MQPLIAPIAQPQPLRVDISRALRYNALLDLLDQEFPSSTFDPPPVAKTPQPAKTRADPLLSRKKSAPEVIGHPPHLPATANPAPTSRPPANPDADKARTRPLPRRPSASTLASNANANAGGAFSFPVIEEDDASEAEGARTSSGGGSEISSPVDVGGVTYLFHGADEHGGSFDIERTILWPRATSRKTRSRSRVRTTSTTSRTSSVAPSAWTFGPSPSRAPSVAPSTLSRPPSVAPSRVTSPRPSRPTTPLADGLRSIASLVSAPATAPAKAHLEEQVEHWARVWPLECAGTAGIEVKVERSVDTFVDDTDAYPPELGRYGRRWTAKHPRVGTVRALQAPVSFR